MRFRAACSGHVQLLGMGDQQGRREPDEEYPEIHNYISTFRTNSILESFNSKIANIKTKARDFRNMNNFINMIYFVCGGAFHAVPTSHVTLSTRNSK